MFENEEIAFYQMNGLVLGTWRAPALEADMGRASAGTGAIALAHNVNSPEEVTSLMESLVLSGGQVLRAPDAPPHGGYVADPDAHVWGSPGTQPGASTTKDT